VYQITIFPKARCISVSEFQSHYRKGKQLAHNTYCDIVTHPLCVLYAHQIQCVMF
jgi:hypothetical protein